MNKIDPSEVTPRHLYLSRRQFIGAASVTLAGALALAACKGNVPGTDTANPPVLEPQRILRALLALEPQRMSWVIR